MSIYLRAIRLAIVMFFAALRGFEPTGYTLYCTCKTRKHRVFTVYSGHNRTKWGVASGVYCWPCAYSSPLGAMDAARTLRPRGCKEVPEQWKKVSR